MPTKLVEWNEPSNCPKCTCGWGIRIDDKGTILIFCSNPKCVFSWQSKARTLYEAVRIWNKICQDHEGHDRPNTPLLVQIYSNDKPATYRIKDLPKK